MLASKLKIGFVLDDSLDKTDGVQQYVLSLGEWLKSKGHTVHYLVSNTVRKDIGGVHSLGNNVSVKFNGNTVGTPLPVSKKRIHALLQAENYDVLHVQLPFSPFLAHKVIHLAPQNTVLVGTFHIMPISGLATLASRVLGIWTRRSWRKFHHIFSVSSAAQEFALKVFRVKSTVLPNVVDVSRFATAEPFDKEAKTILFLGRLVPRKGCLTLLRAINSLQTDDSLPEFRVVICGKGELMATLKEYVRKNHLKNVEFTGFITEADKPRYYATADISVFPSSGGESFGIVLLEAMVSGKAAVLAGDNAGYRAVLGQREQMIFDAKDADALAAKLKHLLANESERLTEAAWGKEFAKKFDVSVVGSELLKEYNKVLRVVSNLP
jgi:phosphatidylinositol alpha-mannosyltransferase